MQVQQPHHIALTWKARPDLYQPRVYMSYSILARWSCFPMACRTDSAVNIGSAARGVEMEPTQQRFTFPRDIVLLSLVSWRPSIVPYASFVRLL